MEATTKLKCFVLARDRFVEILGPLYSLMAREKSPAVVTQRLMKLQTKVCVPALGAQDLSTISMMSWQPGKHTGNTETLF